MQNGHITKGRERRGKKKRKKEKEYCVPNKTEARMQECRNVNVLQAVIKILDTKIKLRKDEDLKRHDTIQFI